MQVFVTYTHGKSIAYYVDRTTTVADLMSRIADRENLAPKFRLMCKGLLLHDGSKTLGELGVVNGTTLQCVFHMCGGMWTAQSGRAAYTVGAPSSPPRRTSRCHRE